MDIPYKALKKNNLSAKDSSTVLIVLHRPCILPELSSIYTPIQVGYAQTINSSFLRDDSGDNIAAKNSSYCELTALYWAWKNLNTDIVGLCHYRRFFGSPLFQIGRKKDFINESQIKVLMKEHDIILPKKRHYWIETRESQYAHAHHIEDLRVTESVLLEKYPSYLPEWKQMLASRSGHICNMFIMRKDLLDEYCSWLFDILFEVEKRLDISSYSKNDKRVFGFLGERMLDVWVAARKLRYAEVPMINLESQHWLQKGFLFVKRKIIGKKNCEA